MLNDDVIPGDCGVAVESGIPQASKRIDLLLSGRDEAGRANLLIVELKQWEHAKRTPMDGVVRTRFAHGKADTSHPSYQSWSYAELLRNFNVVGSEDVERKARSPLECASKPCQARDCHMRGLRRAWKIATTTIRLGSAMKKIE